MIARKPSARFGAAVLALAASAGGADANERVDAHGFEVVAQEVTITPDFETRSIDGAARIRVESRRDGVDRLTFTANALTIVEARVGRTPVSARTEAGRLVFALPRPLRRGERVVLQARWRGAPTRGLTFGERSVHTGYFTCDWMICDQDRPGDLAELDLTLVLPVDLILVATGELRGRTIEGSFQTWRWRQARPTGAFLYGFAAGRFHEVRPAHARANLRVLGDGVQPEALSTLFRDTGAMVDFFEANAGVRLPGDGYAQVVIRGSGPQEAAGLSFLGPEQVEPMLSDPDEDWAIAHELSHQWWGVLVGCESWGEMWLNEGFATFMTAAWKERRWGRAAYDREMELARRRLEAAREAGWDRPLAYAGEYPSLRFRRAVTYSKAALFLDELRRTLGDEAFWKGVRDYTRAHVGKTVTSRDFQAAMERSSGRDLSVLFDGWVYPAA